MFEQSRSALGFNGRRIVCWILSAILLLLVASVVARIAHAGEEIFFFAFVIAAVALGVRSIQQARQRTKAFHQVAETLGFEYFGSSLPARFPLRETQSRQSRSISRVFVYSRMGKDMLFFDCELGYGRGRFSRTVVAVRGDRSEFGFARFGPDLATETVRGWTVVYGERRFLETEEIMRLVNAAITMQSA
jgi:hypothetical protein